MKKVFTLIAMAVMAFSANAQTTWNFSEWEAKEYSETFTKDNLTIVATGDAPITIDGNKKTVEDVQYTQRLKFGGTGSAEARHLKFDVAGSCSIKVILCSASGSEERQLNINTGAFDKENPASTMVAPAGSPVATTYEYSGDATTIYLYSPKSGVNIYAIIVSSTTGIQNTKASDKSDVRYNLAGQQVDASYKGVVIESGKKMIQK